MVINSKVCEVVKCIQLALGGIKVGWCKHILAVCYICGNGITWWGTSLLVVCLNSNQISPRLWDNSLTLKLEAACCFEMSDVYFKAEIMDVFKKIWWMWRQAIFKRKSLWKFWCEVGKDYPSPGWHAVIALLPFGPTFCVGKLFLPLR